MPLDDISAIIAKVQSGQKEYFQYIYEAYIDKIYQFVYQRVSHKSNAEDLTSEIFIRIYNNIENYSDKGNFKAWIYTIARNIICDFWRNQSKESQFSFDDSIRVEQHQQTIESFFFHIDPVLFPPDKDTKKSISPYLSQLKEKEQNVIKERFFFNQSVKETAKTLGISESNVKVITHRVLKKLNKIIPTPQ